MTRRALYTRLTIPTRGEMFPANGIRAAKMKIGEVKFIIIRHTAHEGGAFHYRQGRWRRR